jgi:hypothetical protein
MNRREFLRTGTALAAGLCSRSVIAQDPKPPPWKAKAAIWLWLDGVPSQFETWDPKPGLPSAGGVGAIPTSVEGVQISERLPLCAKQLHRLSLIRTVVHDGKDPAESAYLMHCGLRPSCWDVDVPIGSILAYELWRPGAGVPPFIVLDSPPIPQSSILGEAFLPLYVTGAVPEIRRRGEGDRWGLLAAQDRSWSSDRRQKPLERLLESRSVAEAWMNSPMREALDPSGEPADLLKAYGTGFGRNCLIARRLIQAGVGVVEVGLRGWDAAKDVDARPLCAELDAGLSTLVRDLADKDLLKDTVVFCASASGRTREKGPEPWTKGFSVVMAGGSLAGGRVVGDTGADGTTPFPKVPLWNLFATLLRACGVNSNKSYDSMARKNKYVSQGGSVSTSGTPIKELF